MRAKTFLKYFKSLIAALHLYLSHNYNINFVTVVQLIFI